MSGLWKTGGGPQWPWYLHWASSKYEPRAKANHLQESIESKTRNKNNRECSQFTVMAHFIGFFFFGFFMILKSAQLRIQILFWNYKGTIFRKSKKLPFQIFPSAAFQNWIFSRLQRLWGRKEDPYISQRRREKMEDREYLFQFDHRPSVCFSRPSNSRCPNYQ